MKKGKEKKERVEEKENIEKNPLQNNIKKKQNKQIFIAIVLMVSVVLIIFLVPFIIQNYFNKFTYINLDFTKEKYGEVMFYNTIIPLVDNNGKIIRDYGLDLRSDPRTLENIPVNISEGDLKVIRGAKTYVSVASVDKCQDNVIAMVNLARFLGGFAQLDVKGASANESYAKENNQTYANCNTNPNSTVIIIKSGDETRIDKTGKNCYELSYTNCEVIPVTEKFVLKILEQYMENFEKK